MPLTPEQAREYGKIGAEVSKAVRKIRRKDTETRAKEILQKKAPVLARELLKVALDQEAYDIPDKLRVAAMLKALEWGIGRPVASKSSQEEQEQSRGIEIGVREDGQKNPKAENSR